VTVSDAKSFPHRSGADSPLKPVKSFNVGGRSLSLYWHEGRLESAPYSLYWDDERNPVQTEMVDLEVFDVLAGLFGELTAGRKPTDEQAPPASERADLPAVWDLAIDDVERGLSEIPAPDDREQGDPAYVYGALLGMVRGVALHLGTDLVADMRQRDATGRARYGTPLQPFNGRDALVDAYQELLDATVYLRQSLYEAEQKTSGPAPQNTEHKTP
jgi:hypothetical protein